MKCKECKEEFNFKLSLRFFFSLLWFLFFFGVLIFFLNSISMNVNYIEAPSILVAFGVTAMFIVTAVCGVSFVNYFNFLSTCDKCKSAMELARNIFMTEKEMAKQELLDKEKSRISTIRKNRVNHFLNLLKEKKGLRQ